MPSPPSAYRPALTRYQLARNPLTRAIQRVLPEESGLVHAVPAEMSESAGQEREPRYLDVHRKREAVCGTPVMVLLPGTFHLGGAELCQSCAGRLRSAQGP